MRLGTVSRGSLKEEFELALSEDLNASFARPGVLYSLDFDGDYFWILVHGILLPWELDEEYEG